jgi:hypothetical protein
MKKGITILMAILIFVSAAIVFSSSVVASDYIIDSDLQISGNGSFNRELLAQTELGYAGKRMEESYYTRWMGTDGLTILDYDSSLEMFMGKSLEFEETPVATIDYAQTAMSTNAKQTICSQNYDIGVAQGAKLKGNAIKSFEVNMDDRANEFNIEGSINGYIKLRQKVVDPVNQTVYLYEITELDGRYDFNWDAYAERTDYPAGDEAWLGCP